VSKQIFTTKVEIFSPYHEVAANLSSYFVSALSDVSDIRHTPKQHGHVKTVWPSPSSAMTEPLNLLSSSIFRRD